MSTWQPIETAPIQPFRPEEWFMKHSPFILVWTGHHCIIASYHYSKNGNGKWRSSGIGIAPPTHWMPLPDGPL